MLKYGEPFNPFGIFNGLFIPNSIAMSDISDSAKLLLGRLNQFAGPDGQAFPSRNTLATALHWKLRKLDRNIKTLKDLQLIETYQKTEHSPSTYIFLYNKLYEFKATDKSDSGATDKSDSGATDKSDSGGTVIDDKHKQSISKQSISNNCFSKEKRVCKQTRGKRFNGLYCSICNKKQFETRSGVTCKNGHGGVKGFEKKKPKLGKLKKIIVKKENPNPFNYSKETLQILDHWQACGGKVHKKITATKGPNLINLNIEELLMTGRNPFIGVIDDDLFELRTKAWSVDEIKSCIDQYVKVKHKPINKMYFNEFILFRYNNWKVRKLPDYSPLVESFQELQGAETESKLFKPLKTKFKALYPDTDIYDTVYVNIANFLQEQEGVYEVTSNGLCYQYSLVNLFVDYIKEKVNTQGTTNLMEYMSGKTFLNTFINEKLSSNMIERISLVN